MAGRIFAWIYVAGYVLYVGGAAVSAWPKMGLADWWTFVAFQAGLYGWLWPLWLTLNLLGVHW